MDSLIVIILVFNTTFCCGEQNRFDNDFSKADSLYNKEVICKPKETRFKKLFAEADSAFTKSEYNIDYEEMKKASKMAANEAWEKTKHCLPQSMHKYWKYD